MDQMRAGMRFLRNGEAETDAPQRHNVDLHLSQFWDRTTGRIDYSTTSIGSRRIATMGRFKGFEPACVIPATLLAFNTDMSIDEAETRRHLLHVAGTRGITAITVNGHSNEVHALNFEEQQRVLSFSLAAVGDKLPLINGVYADGSIEAARIAKMAAKEGASGL
ncbi:MAG: dihydrodipicolinate synthase family protein, partial [Rhizobiales bacterium]|nr:dihydrodipicolinate synthase family protein [Hyphomicrobiales bacterium]